MKRLDFSETKRTPRYSLRKLNVGVASVLLGVTIFGINFTNHSVKAATTSSPNSNSQQTSAAVLTTAEQTKGINAIGAVKVPSLTDSQTAAKKAIDDALNNKKSEINGATTIDQTTKDKLNQAATDAADNNSTEATTTLQSAPKTQGSAGSGASGSSATGVVSRSQDSNSQAASATSSAATDSQAAPETQVPAPAASQSSESANSGNATSSQASQAGTVSANQTSNTSAAGAPASSDQTVTVDETTLPATQAAILSTNLARSTKFKVGTRQLHSAIRFSKLARLTSSETDTELPPTTQTYTKVEQPLLYDYLLHTATGTRDGKTWVDKTVAKGIFGQDYPGHTLDTIFGTTSNPGIITKNPYKYFFAAYVDFGESYHRVILLARSQDTSDKNLYSYTIHTYSQNNSTTTTKPGESIKEQYPGTGGSTHDLIFQNYDGDSFSVKLNGFKEGQEYGLLPVFDGGLLDPTYGSNTLDQNDTAAKTKSIGFWASMIPQETSTKVRYVDQATGKDIVQPMKISGFGYQGFKVKGEAPTVKGYKLVSKPEFLPSTNKASDYEDGTISPYKVGQTYDLALSDSVVIKQTVIDTNGTVRATPYYNGSPLSYASKVLGRESDNDYMSFYTSDGKSYAYTNRIGQVGDSYIYYYAKDSDLKGSEMRLHFIDVTGVNNSYYAPSDGPELDVDKVQTIHGNIGENYSFTYTVPTNYYEVGSSDVKGTYSGTHHDAYVYVKIDRKGAKATIENLKHLNHAQKQAAEAAIDQATDLNTMNQAISTATTLDGDMGKLSDLTADLTNTNNYKYASDKPKSTVAADYTNADVLFDKDDKTAGQNADDATVLKLIDQINTHKSSLDGDTNLSAAKTTISGLTHLNDAQRSAANQAVTNASDLTGLNTAVGNAQSVDSAMIDLQTAVNQANEAKTTNNYLQASADKQDNLNSAVQNAQDVLAATVANDSANQVKDLTKSVNDAVDALDGDAINAINAALTDKKAAINGTNLTAEEKTAVINKAQKLADDAIANINKATTNDAVKTAKENGVETINNINVPATSATKSAAKDAIDQAAKTKDAAIDASNLTAEEKDALKKQVSDEVKTAKAAIDGATKDADVESAKNTGVETINNINVPATSATKSAAKDAIDQAAKTKNAAIDASNLTDEEKADLKKTVAGEVKTAKDNIDAAPKDADVKTAQTNGEKAINAVEIPKSSKTKKDANSDLDNTAAAAKKAIDETSGLTDDQKQTAKDQIDKAVADAKENIKNASDNKGVADATAAGKLAIDKVSANAAIDDALAKKIEEINKANLTDDEK
ncbi:DUF1542 domain-containing protein, partial [Lactobacillus johnsonii]|uniref:DUF1542 domain-containing protein n=1 Tax=Lactobacillus johnsonii TaxID=33959 RepID=UPI000BEEE144